MLLVPKTKDAPPSDPDWYGLDFAVAPVGTEPVFPERQENPSDSCSGFFAHLKQRAIAVWGPTPEEATRRLIGYVAALTAAGCLDHTGEPALAHNQRRYQMVFGEPGAEQPTGLSRQLQRVPLSTTS